MLNRGASFSWIVSLDVPRSTTASSLDQQPTVLVNINSEQGYVHDYTLLLSATEKSLPPGYLSQNLHGVGTG